MQELIDQSHPALEVLCQRHHVKTLELFGSASNGRFDASRSDLDFLVEFQPMAPAAHSKEYFGLWFALEDLFGRKVDLVEVAAATNPYFLQGIRSSRRVIYAA